MEIFSRTRDNEIEFGQFLDKVDSIYKSLVEFEKEIDLFDIMSIKKSFRAKTDDFFREDRKLNIGIIGRVKVGKSSFLNTLLFEGKNVLPAAVTPKTAVLTKIEYDAENRLDIEYFTYEEWKLLKTAAEGDSSKNEYKVAHEITTMVKERNLVPEDFIHKQTESIYYETYEELMENINDYVGENGKYTPMVKSVRISVDREELEDISIVDTPGLYDPILSRVDKTKQFMELCDVVFFLSKSTSFLDKNDIDLVASQLPKKGVKKVVLVCSRFDDGIRDTLWSKESLKEAVDYTKKQLCKYAAEAFENYKSNNYYVSEDVLNQFKQPIFVSATVQNMADKNLKDLSKKEQRVYEDLTSKGPVTIEMLNEIGNMDTIHQIFGEVISKKDEMLMEKASSFIPDAKDELSDKLRRIQMLARKRIVQLSTYDTEKLNIQKKEIVTQINRMNADLEVVFNQLKEKIEQHKLQAISEIRAYNREYLQVSEKEGITTHFEIRKESTAKWFKPWTWGTNSRVIYSYDEKYQYIDAYDAVENIRNFVEDGKECIELAFNKSLDVAVLKNDLLSIIIENLDALGENFDASYYKLLVEKTLSSIKIPLIEFPTTPFEDIITSEFTGEIKSNSMKSNFRKVLSDTIYDVREGICNKLEKEVIRFESSIDDLKNNFANNLLMDIHKEMNYVMEQFQNKEVEIERYTKLIEVIDKVKVGV